MTASLTASDGSRLAECLAGGGVAVFPTDTVYGVGCSPEDEGAAPRLYELKGRPATRASAVMFFALEPALLTLSELPGAERLALQALLPGPVTVLLANRRGHFAAACRSDPGTLGLRVPRLPNSLSALGSISSPVMQSSANISGEPDARRLQDVPARLLDGADLVLDGGELPGIRSTVVDLRDFASERRWHLLREGALARQEVQDLLDAVG